MKEKGLFKKWVESHSPDAKWDWTNPEEIRETLVDAIQDLRYIDLISLFHSYDFVGDCSDFSEEEYKAFFSHQTSK